MPEVRGYAGLAGNLAPLSKNIQQLRWRTRASSGYRPEDVPIPKRFLEIATGTGSIDAASLSGITEPYTQAIRSMRGRAGREPSAQQAAKTVKVTLELVRLP